MKPTQTISKQKAIELAHEIVKRSQVQSQFNRSGEFEQLRVIMPRAQFAQLYSEEVLATVLFDGRWLLFTGSTTHDFRIVCRTSDTSLDVLVADIPMQSGSVVRFFNGKRKVGGFRLAKYSSEIVYQTPFGLQLLTRMATRVFDEIERRTEIERLSHSDLPAIQIVPESSKGLKPETLFQGPLQ